MKYFFVLEETEQNYVAYVPDLPGCVASGKTAAETRKAIKEAVNMHLQGLAADGLRIPEPVVKADYIDAIQSPAPEEQEESKFRKLLSRFK